MPDTIAHNTFGNLVFNDIENEQIKRIIFQNKNLYNLGLQGGDIFFFYSLLSQSDVNKFGSNLHHQQSIDFFNDAVLKCRGTDEKLLSYIFGYCCHYALDSVSHRELYKVTKDTVDHRLIESELDYLIKEKYYVKSKRYTMIDKNIDINAIKKLFAQNSLISTKEIKKSIVNMRFAMKMFDNKLVMNIIDKLMNKNGLLSSLVLEKNNKFPDLIKTLINCFDSEINTANNLICELYKKYIDENYILQAFTMNYEGELNETI